MEQIEVDEGKEETLVWKVNKKETNVLQEKEQFNKVMSIYNHNWQRKIDNEVKIL